MFESLKMKFENVTFVKIEEEQCEMCGPIMWRVKHLSALH